MNVVIPVLVSYILKISSKIENWIMVFENVYTTWRRSRTHPSPIRFYGKRWIYVRYRFVPGEKKLLNTVYVYAYSKNSRPFSCLIGWAPLFVRLRIPYCLYVVTLDAPTKFRAEINKRKRRYSYATRNIFLEYSACANSKAASRINVSEAPKFLRLLRIIIFDAIVHGRVTASSVKLVGILL